MLLGEILALVGCAGTAAAIVVATSPLWLRTATKLWKDISNRVEEAQDALDGKNGEDK